MKFTHAIGLALTAVGAVFVQACTASPPVAVPAPLTDVAVSTLAGPQTAVFAGGCFWGVQAVFQHVRGVTNVVSGYSGGEVKNPGYARVSTGTTGHAEAVRVTFDPTKVSYGQLLQVFFSVAHDPTQVNRQGPDVGTQYRSAIFYADAEQQRVANAYIAQLDAAKIFPQRIATQVAPLQAFYPAEEYHQDYVARHPREPYIVINDLPKVANLRAQFGSLYSEQRSPTL